MFDGSYDFNFNFDEAIAPPDRNPVPSGPYHVALFDMTPDSTDKGFVILRMQLKVQGGQYNDRIIFDDWFMPNKQLQDAKKYRESMGYLQEKLQAMYGTAVVGNINLNPLDLLGRECIVNVTVVQDKQLDKDTGEVLRNEQGHVLTYPPKNRVNKYMPLTQAGPAAQAVGAQPVAPQPSSPQAVSLGQPATPVAQPVAPQPVAPQAAAPVAAPAAAPQAAAPTAPAAPNGAATEEQSGASAFML